jgi:hypothetical protein
MRMHALFEIRLRRQLDPRICHLPTCTLTPATYRPAHLSATNQPKLNIRAFVHFPTNSHKRRPGVGIQLEPNNPHHPGRLLFIGHAGAYVQRQCPVVA